MDHELPFALFIEQSYCVLRSSALYTKHVDFLDPFMRQIMPKTHRPLSPYAADAVRLLGQLVRKARIEKRMTTTDAAVRSGISRGLLNRIEKGDPTCAIGAAFEVAAVVGVP